MSLQNKTVLLTGATGGIGILLSSKLEKSGCRVIKIGRDPSKKADYHADLSDQLSRASLIKQIQSDIPHIDILINCAGIGIYKKLEDFTPSDWLSSYELNVHTPFFLAQALGPDLTVNLGSCSALQHHPTRSLYNSTKAALRIMSLCLADEHPGKFVHITLDSTLTSFGSLTLEEKLAKKQAGKFYLDPDWVTSEIVQILGGNPIDPEYTLSPDCYDHCGVWHKP